MISLGKNFKNVFTPTIYHGNKQNQFALRSKRHLVELLTAIIIKG